MSDRLINRNTSLTILISGQGDLKDIPADIPPQNVIILGLMAGSAVFLSGFNDKGELTFKNRLVGNSNVVIDLPLVIDWENKVQQLGKEINALTQENMELRKKLIAVPGIIPGDGNGPGAIIK